MVWSDGEAIADGDSQAVGGNHLGLLDVAEEAPRLLPSVAVLDGPEIRRIARTLVRVTQPAKSLKVLRGIRAAMLPRLDVIYIERTFLPLTRRTARSGTPRV
jgi:hypothetical protein